MLEIVASKHFQKTLLTLSNAEREMVLQRIEAFARGDENVDVKKLQPKHLGFYRIRSGKFRIVFEYRDSTSICLLKIDNRDSIYLRFS